ncbi:MAG TPA: phosphoribosylaminoimidazolesuccinocarboxamide synthase, partial [Candidatus Limnocylindrales bacterium]
MPLASAFVRSGKVRDLYRVDDDRLLLVASDRLSAFDVILPTPIADKGRILTGLSRFWFRETADIVANHLLSTDPEDLPAELTGGDPVLLADLRGRMMLGRRAEVLPVECVVRGYVSGSGWKDYRASGSICG